jgi:hypothetical protein
MSARHAGRSAKRSSQPEIRIRRQIKTDEAPRVKHDTPVDDVGDAIALPEVVIAPEACVEDRQTARELLFREGRGGGRRRRFP